MTVSTLRYLLEKNYVINIYLYESKIQHKYLLERSNIVVSGCFLVSEPNKYHT